MSELYTQYRQPSRTMATLSGIWWKVFSKKESPANRAGCSWLVNSNAASCLALGVLDSFVLRTIRGVESFQFPALICRGWPKDEEHWNARTVPPVLNFVISCHANFVSVSHSSVPLRFDSPVVLNMSELYTQYRQPSRTMATLCGILWKVFPFPSNTPRSLVTAFIGPDGWFAVFSCSTSQAAFWGCRTVRQS